MEYCGLGYWTNWTHQSGLSVIDSVLYSAQMSTRLNILTSYLGQVVCGQLGVGDTGLSGQGEIVGCGRYWTGTLGDTLLL